MRRSVAAALTLVVLGGCSTGGAPGSTTEPLPPTSAIDDVDARFEKVQRALDQWRGADTLTEARAAADLTRLLITGPDIEDLRPEGAGGVEVGLLPDEDGGPGLASAVASCAGPDLLGGSWDDPEQGWIILRDAIAAWAPDGNTFPDLPSHAQRVVGWATLTLRADDLAEAQEYSGHAQLHVDASRDALTTCS